VFTRIYFGEWKNTAVGDTKPIRGSHEALEQRVAHL
jgi:hypothetical protein